MWPIVVCQCILTSVEIILVHRVQALYPHRHYRSICVIIAITSQSIILYLTIHKHIVASRSGWSRTPIISLLMRDGATSYAVMIALEIVTMVYRLTGGIAYVPQCVSTVYVLFDNNVNLSWVMAVLLGADSLSICNGSDSP